MHQDAPKLVIMAAGMGSRFGGLKQMEPVDDEGHSIIDFSMYDARRAGFRDLVFIIKREHEALFRERIGDRKSIDRIYEVYRAFFTAHPSWSLFAITADKTVEAKAFGRPADRRRKLYNGRLEVCYYQFHGQKPPQKQEIHRTK